jgi:hypothetical protein
MDTETNDTTLFTTLFDKDGGPQSRRKLQSRLSVYLRVLMNKIRSTMLALLIPVSSQLASLQITDSYSISIIFLYESYHLMVWVKVVLYETSEKHYFCWTAHDRNERRNGR